MILDQTDNTLPQPEEIPNKERDDAMGAYLMMFASLAAGLPLPIINLIASIIYYFMNRGKSRFVHFHTLQSLISQIPTSIANAVLMGWTVRNIVFAEINDTMPFDDTYLMYLAFVIVLNLVYFIFSLIAAVRAKAGRFYYFVIFGKIAFDYVYSKDESRYKKQNTPPR